MGVKELQDARDAIQIGDKNTARRILRTVVQDDPSADAWYLAARVAKNRDQALVCLNRAIQLDPLHTNANRMHKHLTETSVSVETAADAVPLPTMETLTSEIDIPERQKPAPKRWRRRVMLFSFLLLSVSSSWFTMSALGLGSEYLDPIRQRLGLIEAPLEEFEGTPVEEIEAPAAVLPAQTSRDIARGIDGTDGDIMHIGQLHEYRFSANSGEEIAIGIQFFSPSATDVSSNVEIVDPIGQRAAGRCIRDFILDEQTGVAFICQINSTGEWKVRVYGRDGESEGVYIVSIAALPPLD